jgi:hypothetical protein
MDDRTVKLPTRMSDRTSDELAAEARERTHQQVRDIFTRAREAPERTCPHCGEQARTEQERCPACGKSYFAKPARFSRRTRLLLQVGAALVGGAAVALLVVVLTHQAHRNELTARQRQAAIVTAERRRLAREQRPHHAAATPTDDVSLLPAARRVRRSALVQRLEAAIAADARGRVERHELSGRSIRGARCHALVNGARGDELDLGKPLGRYACEAALGTATSGGVTSTLGLPFVGTIDFTRGRLTWCKDNPVSAGDVKQVLAFVRLARECTAARGPAFGSGYLIEPR